MKCTRCQRELPKGTVFCPYCGAQTKESVGDYNLYVSRPSHLARRFYQNDWEYLRNNRDDSDPRSIEDYQQRMGFGFNENNFTQTEKFDRNHFPQESPHLFSRFTKNSHPCIIAFEKNGLLIMPLRIKTYYHFKRGVVAELWYYFTGENSFIPKQNIQKIILESHFLEQRLKIKTANMSVWFDMSSSWNMYLFSPQTSRVLSDFIKGIKK